MPEEVRPLRGGRPACRCDRVLQVVVYSRLAGDHRERLGRGQRGRSTLKATAPSPTSPVNGAQPESLVLTAGRGTAKFATVSFAHEFQIRTSGGTVVAACTSTVPAGSGSTLSYTPTCSLDSMSRTHGASAP